MRLLDVRSEALFLQSHHPLAANIPLDQLAARVHELPRRHLPLLVFDDHPVRARWACSRLRARGFESVGPFDSPRHDWIVGPARVRLWQPHALLERAAEWIQPAPGLDLALDLACGTGRDAVHLALSGWRVHAWDILPDALDRAADLARRYGVTLATRRVDVERTAWADDDAFDLVTVFNFLHRPLLPILRRMVRPGGCLVYETFVDPQRERFGKPRRLEYSLRPDELRRCFADWSILHYAEQLTGPRRMAAGLIARRPA